ncbi:MAG: exopolyphosphatase/guanosine-5'-triphosphate,3'-diphosphate pyrophosphatase [Gammaproteobacteria bacterium]|jgi:exopolyphosphatase/guanosine-5'-triphosphate,3'-diphosphate pyrophosphatase
MTNDLSATIAAVDLGSNSFHLVVAETSNGRFKIIDRMRTMVRLAAGLTSDNQIDDEALLRAIKCLQQFGERLRDLESNNVRIVGTNTLRIARNGPAFQAQAEAAVGYPIDVISGREEARLIYLGVSHGLEDESDLRLVIDIGGGSTELILGRHFDPIIMESLHMGCVAMSAAHFSDGKITDSRLKLAEIRAKQELEPLEATYREKGWQSVIGASGTNVAIRDVVIANGWSKDGITASSLLQLRSSLVSAGHVDKLNLPGLSEERRAVFPGGVAILLGIFQTLGIEHMRVSSSALREGLLYDLQGRIQHEDVREKTIESLVDRYSTDRAQSHRVFGTAKDLWLQVNSLWNISGTDLEQLLRWASALHEIGSAIAHSQYHKHGSYLLTHLDMPGFSRGEQRTLAVLVRGHRRKFPVAEFQTLADASRDKIEKLSVLLRLAVVLHRRRREAQLPSIQIRVEEDKIRLRFPDEWLGQHQLTVADLEQEADYLKTSRFRLKFK